MTSPTDDQYADLVRDILLAEPIRGVPTQPTRLLDHVYIGSQSNAESLRLLRSLNITHVLNCAGYKGPRPTPDASPYEGLGIDYYEFQAEDTDRYDICQHFNEAFSYLDKIHRQHGVALVHCALGINRSAAVCLGYMMVHKRMPLLEATKVIKDRRRVVLANKHFQRLLVKFARSRGLLDNILIKSEEPRTLNNNNDGIRSSRDLSRYSNIMKMSRQQDQGRYSMREDYDTPTFSANDSDLPQFSSSAAKSQFDSSLYQSNGGTYSSSNGFQNGDSNGSSVGCRGGRFNGFYKDLFDRFDRLAESLKVAGRATVFGSRSSDNRDGYLPFNRQSQSMTGHQKAQSRPDVTSRYIMTSQREENTQPSLFSRTQRAGSTSALMGVARPSSTTPWSSSAMSRHNSVGGYRPGSATPRPGAITPRPQKCRPVSCAPGGY